MNSTRWMNQRLTSCRCQIRTPTWMERRTRSQKKMV